MLSVKLLKRENKSKLEVFVNLFDISIKINPIVFVSYCLMFSFLVICLSLTNKENLHLFINSFHNSFFDSFFKYVTYLGDGALFGVLIVLFYFINKRTSLTYVFTGVLTLVLVHLFKKIIFKGIPRPVEFIGADSLHLIDGVKMAHWHSFPSGHTTTAFAIATILIFTSRNSYLQAIYFLFAVLAAFSRVYLSQHFVIDVVAGSLLGIAIGMASLKIVSALVKKYKLFKTKI